MAAAKPIVPIDLPAFDLPGAPEASYPVPEREIRSDGTATRAALYAILATPVPFDPDQARAVLDHLAAGRDLTDVVKTAGLPSAVVVAAWRSEVPAFDRAVEVALELRADALVAMAENVAFTEENPKMLAAKGGLLLKLAGMRSRRYAGVAGRGEAAEGRGVELNRESEERIAALVLQAGALRPRRVVAEARAELDAEPEV